jgi:4-amino-4-deoxy-L-arabinose transferase-like glycosyltransferase
MLQQKQFPTSLAISMVMCAALWLLAYPYYKYFIDADAVAYLTIAERAAKGDWSRSINGLWSPLGSWVLVPFIKAGHNGFAIAQFINLICALAILPLWFFLAKKFAKQDLLLNFVTLALAPVLVYYSYLQVFGDLMQVCMLLAYLHVCTQTNFIKSISLHILAGAICGIAFYAKAYSFPFLILHLAALHAWHWYHYKKIIFIQAASSIIICILVMLPWSLTLSKKYDAFSLTGNSGKLNMSWYLLGHKEFKDSIKVLVPPTYDDSPSFWEDPYPSQAQLHSPFESVEMLLVKWPPRIIYTCLIAVSCCSEISSMLLIGILIACLIYRKSKDAALAAITLACLVMPLGYLAMHIETRYIWLSGLTGIILCIIVLQHLNYQRYKWALSIFFAMSLLVYPAYHMYQLRNKGKQNFELAQLFKQHNLQQCKFTGNAEDASDAWVIALLSRSHFYSIDQFDYRAEDLISDMKRYSLTHYLYKAENDAITSKQFDGFEAEIVFQQGAYTMYKLQSKQ